MRETQNGVIVPATRADARMARWRSVFVTCTIVAELLDSVCNNVRLV